MKITAVETFCLSFDMPYALTFARGEYQTREALLVKIHTDQPDLTGWGEAAMWGGPHAVSVAVIEKEIAPLIVGEDPRRPEFLWEKVYQHTYYHGRKGILLACLSGVDIALWDILGKSLDQPLWRLLGGFGKPLATYASSGYYRRDYSLDDFAADVAKARQAGHRGYKMKIGNIADSIHKEVIVDTPLKVSIEEDLRRVEVATRGDRHGPRANGGCQYVAGYQDGAPLRRWIGAHAHPLVRRAGAAGKHRGLHGASPAKPAYLSRASRPRPANTLLPPSWMPALFR